MAVAAVEASAPMPQPYADSIQHLLGELERLDLLIRQQVGRMRRRHPQPDPLEGLYISDAEIDALLARPAGRPRWLEAEPSELDRRTDAALGFLSTNVADRVAASRRHGIVLRLDRLAARCGLDAGETELLLIALAPDIDPRYQRLYAYLQDDVTRRRPTVDLALDLICPGLDAKLAALRRFAPDAPLRRHRLLALTAEPGQPPPPLPGLSLKAEDGILDHVLGFDHLVPQLASCARRAAPGPLLDALALPAGAAAALAALARGGPPANGLVLHFHGSYGSGRRAAAQALCAAFGCELLVVDGDQVALMPEPDAVELIGLLRRETRLRAAAVFWDGFDALLDDKRRPLLRSVLAAVADATPVAFLGGERSWVPRDGMLAAPFVQVAFPRPGARERIALWRRALADLPQASADADIESLANGFRLTGGEIRDAVATARNLARGRDGPTLPDLQSACRLHSSQILSALAQKIEPRYRWDDLILPPDRMAQLREIADAVKFRARVHDDWGFGAKLALGKGMCALFTGPSGTGKTLAAEVIAGELALDLYKIDLAAVVSKYIGETEKNLSRIFAEAEASNAILFFDEADALFGKRSEVRDAHDRYANIETAYLLQRLEAYEGLVILATNLKKNMDEAFVRRLQTAIEFPMPSEPDRRRLWAGIWPEATPLGPDVDLDALARRFELAGGNIKNIALAAAFLAAADGGAVTMAHLLRATGREFQKMGRIISPGELALVGAARTSGG
jgi:AAA+ superfamily predicted ATPase